MKALCFFLWILLASPLAASYEYDLSICMIFRDEAPYLREWIEFHRLVGVEHFYLYNNLSQDNFKEILQPYIDQKIVELFEWPEESSNTNEWDAIQVAAYNDGLKKAKGTTKWLAILDSDEFLFPVHTDSLSQFLKTYEKQPGIGGLLVSWVMYGTSWVEKIPEDKLLIETLVYSQSQGDKHFKTILRPTHTTRVRSPHYAVYEKGFRHCTPSGGSPPFIEIDQVRINHYWSRDEWYLHQFKIPRRMVWNTNPRTCERWAEANNADYDPAIFRFIHPLRARLKK